jgi:prepilin peptidase CpaA
MNGVPFPVGPCVFVLIALASVWDLHQRRIPNWLVAAGLGVAIAVQCVLRGPLEGAGVALGGCLVGGALMLPGYVLRLMGAGDVKLMGAIGAFCGASGAFEVVLATAVIGGVWSLGAMVMQRELRRGLHGAASILMTLVTPGGMNAGARGQDAGQQDTEQNNAQHKVAAHAMGTLPYGVAIALGTVFVLFANA